MLFQPTESYDVARMKHETQDANVVRARYSRRPPCSAAAASTRNTAGNDAAGNIIIKIVILFNDVGIFFSSLTALCWTLDESTKIVVVNAACMIRKYVIEEKYNKIKSIVCLNCIWHQHMVPFFLCNVMSIASFTE